MKLKQIYLRWIYMSVAIVLSWLLSLQPAYILQSEKGIFSTRHYQIDQNNVTVIQTGFEDQIDVVMEVISIKGLHICQQLMFWGSLLCFLSFFSDIWRQRLAIITAVFAGVYYGFFVYYAVHIVDLYFPTLWPTWTIVLPGIIIELMILVRKSIIRERMETIDEGDKPED